MRSQAPLQLHVSLFHSDFRMPLMSSRLNASFPLNRVNSLERSSARISVMYSSRLWQPLHSQLSSQKNPCCKQKQYLLRHVLQFRQRIRALSSAFFLSGVYVER